MYKNDEMKKNEQEVFSLSFDYRLHYIFYSFLAVLFIFIFY